MFRLLAGVTLLVSPRCRSGARSRYAPNTAPTTNRAAPDRRVGARLSRAPDVAGCAAIPSYIPADSESAGFICIAAYVENSLFCRGQGRTPPARRDFGHAAWAVASRELCRSRIDANEKPVAESNLSLRVPVHVAAQCAMCQVVYMAEVVVFGVVAADVVLRVQRIPAPGDHVNAEALGWRIGGSSANMACGLSTAGHHVRLVGPVGTDPMGDKLLAELEQWGVDTEYSFRADIASPRTPDTARRHGRAHDHRGGQRVEPSSFLPVRGPDLRSVDCVYVEGYTRYPTGTAAAAESALLVTSPPVPGATAWPATVPNPQLPGKFGHRFQRRFVAGACG